MDITPNYMYINEAPQRIKEMIPGVKLIFVLRNPVKRAYFHYWDNVRRQAESEDFDNAVKVKPVYINKGLYYNHIKRVRYRE